MIPNKNVIYKNWVELDSIYTCIFIIYKFYSRFCSFPEKNEKIKFLVDVDMTFVGDIRLLYSFLNIYEKRMNCQINSERIKMKY